MIALGVGSLGVVADGPVGGSGVWEWEGVGRTLARHFSGTPKHAVIKISDVLAVFLEVKNQCKRSMMDRTKLNEDTVVITHFSFCPSAAPCSLLISTYFGFNLLMLFLI